MKRFGTRASVLFLAALVCCAEAGRAGDWPGWRGPTGLGYTDEKDLPLTWNGKTGRNVLWKVPLRGGAPGKPALAARAIPVPSSGVIASLSPRRFGRPGPRGRPG